MYNDSFSPNKPDTLYQAIDRTIDSFSMPDINHERERQQPLIFSASFLTKNAVLVSVEYQR